jgi:hypothetical protein
MKLQAPRKTVWITALLAGFVLMTNWSCADPPAESTRSTDTLSTDEASPANLPPAAAAAVPDVAAYRDEVDEWHREREERLRADGGWLSVAGLYWLKEGENSFGTATDNAVILPPGTAPAHVGSFRLADGAVSVTADPAAGVTHDGEPVTEMELATDAEGEPTELVLGSLTFFPIQRVEQIGIRLRDDERTERREFTGIERFPVDPAWRIAARFDPYREPKAIKIPNILGTEFDDFAPGVLRFEVAGQVVTLEPTGDPAEGFFVVFGDTTNGKETYGGGRFLTVEPPEDGVAILDFNRAYDPPCVFTPYATCPLPPRQNKLPVAIEAGEKMYGHGGH